MFMQFDKENTNQKHFYFLLQSVIKGFYDIDHNKIPAVYAIYNQKKCVYVGQSRNISSRISTHYYNAYDNCTHIAIFLLTDLIDDGCSDEYKKNVLDENELFLMHYLKPCDNIINNSGYKSKKEYLIDCFSYEIDELEYGSREELTIYPWVNITNIKGKYTRIEIESCVMIDPLDEQDSYTMIDLLSKRGW